MIGFGCIETDAEKALKNKIENLVIDKYKDEGIDYFTDDFIKYIKGMLNQWADKTQRESDGYKENPDFPDRYYYYFPYIVGDCNFIFFKINIHHINRKHAMSTDGWALMKTELVFYVASTDITPNNPAQPGRRDDE